MRDVLWSGGSVWPSAHGERTVHYFSHLANSIFVMIVGGVFDAILMTRCFAYYLYCSCKIGLFDCFIFIFLFPSETKGHVLRALNVATTSKNVRSWSRAEARSLPIMHRRGAVESYLCAGVSTELSNCKARLTGMTFRCCIPE